MREISLTVIHCSATPSGAWLGGKQPGAAGYRTAPSVIDAWHKERGFARASKARAAWNWALGSIGYHYVIDVDGHVWTGRHLSEVGAHVLGHNAHSVGICLVGGVERNALYTPAQWSALASKVQALQSEIGEHRVCGHRDLSPDRDRSGTVEPREWLKTCPGFDVAAWRAGGMQPLAGHVFTPPGG